MAKRNLLEKSEHYIYTYRGSFSVLSFKVGYHGIRLNTNTMKFGTSNKDIYYLKILNSIWLNVPREKKTYLKFDFLIKKVSEQAHF